MNKAWVSLAIAFVFLIGGWALVYEYDCVGQCAHHTPRGKRCQDRCFDKGHCPQEDR